MKVKFSNGRVLGSKDAHAIPEMRLQILEYYEKKIFAFKESMCFLR